MTSIWFTDHAPFPGDVFGNRMQMCELEEYLSSLTKLKIKYKDIIDIYIGLEIEFLPSYNYYYQNLVADERIDILLLGQHFYEISPDFYNFSLDQQKYRTTEMEGLHYAILEGLQTGYFQICAHPDRIFRYQAYWDDRSEDISKEIIKCAKDNHILLEKNIGLYNKNLYKNQFWNHCSDDNYIIGMDAHSLNELRQYINQLNIFQEEN